MRWNIFYSILCRKTLGSKNIFINGIFIKIFKYIIITRSCLDDIYLAFNNKI